MPYDRTTKKLYIDTSVTPNKGITLGEIAECLRDYRVNTRGGRDLGMLATSPQIKPFARNKPIRNSTHEAVTDADRIRANFGLGITKTSSENGASPYCLAYEYLAPRGASFDEPFRVRDFDGYVGNADDSAMKLNANTIRYSYKGAEGFDISLGEKLDGFLGLDDLAEGGEANGFLSRWEFAIRLSCRSLGTGAWSYIYATEWMPMYDFDNTQIFHISHDILMEGVGITGVVSQGQYTGMSADPMFMAIVARESYGAAEYNVSPYNQGVLVGVYDLPNFIEIIRFTYSQLAIANNMVAADMSTSPITPEYYNGQGLTLSLAQDENLYLGFQIRNATSTTVNQDQVRLRIRWTDTLGEQHTQDCPLQYYGRDSQGYIWQELWSIASGETLGRDSDNRTSPRDWMVTNANLPNITTATKVEMWIVLNSAFTDDTWTTQTGIITINSMMIG